MATDAPTPSDGQTAANVSEEARRERMQSGPLQVFLPADFDRNPGLPPEVWQVRPDGVEPPK